MENFKQTLYEAVLVAYGKVLSKYDILSQPVILRDVGKEILDYLNLHGFGFEEKGDAEDLGRLTQKFVAEGFAESLEIEPAPVGLNYIWRNLYGFNAYKELHTISDNPFLACPLNLCLYFIAERHNKSFVLHSKSFDVPHQTAQSQYEVVDRKAMSDEESLRQLAVNSARLVELSEERERLYRHQATTDALTGLHNRRYYQEHGERILQQSLFARSTSLLMLDIDYFKQVNDNHGHAAGDTVLREVAALCAKALRVQDLCARVGGEEFGLLLPGTDEQGAIAVAERLRSQIAERRISIANDAQASITVSIGVATTSGRLNTLDALTEAADTALYEAKNSGRNRVCAAETPS